MNEMLSRWQPTLLSLFRFITGLLLFQYGIAKIFKFPVLPYFANIPPLIVAAGTLELVLGAALMIGLFTRPAAFVLSGLMASAYFVGHVAKSGSLLPLVNGGTLYVDGGRPAPGLFAQTVANLAEVPPTVYFNVPAGYGQLVPTLEGDAEFADRFFARLRLLFNAAAALPAGLRARLEALAARHAPGRDASAILRTDAKPVQDSTWRTPFRDRLSRAGRRACRPRRLRPSPGISRSARKQADTTPRPW